ncbi:transcriptional regulator, HxlR family [Enhydrobacter aerosaccus]|uniref:Transcriptional regulator, HxlR family n=1 Tax=Enhydrobacter aerosaccus TaxID=225324 RepID=A0A1T4P9T2_9HYPH|nr:transcriptional regulator, HxlR family [Enhydrobacter aerosaccus]
MRPVPSSAVAPNGGRRLQTNLCNTHLMVSVMKPLKHLPPLPAERALKVISGRWKAVILYHLLSGPRRLSDLTRLMPAISQKVLIQQLREMEAHRIVTRDIFREVPPRVEYEATALGRSLESVLLALCEWGRLHAAELDELDRLADCAIASLPRTAGDRNDTSIARAATAPRKLKSPRVPRRIADRGRSLPS